MVTSLYVYWAHIFWRSARLPWGILTRKILQKPISNKQLIFGQIHGTLFKECPLNMQKDNYNHCYLASRFSAILRAAFQKTSYNTAIHSLRPEVSISLKFHHLPAVQEACSWQSLLLCILLCPFCQDEDLPNDDVNFKFLSNLGPFFSKCLHKEVNNQHFLLPSCHHTYLLLIALSVSWTSAEYLLDPFL